MSADLNFQKGQPTVGFEPTTRLLQISRQLNSARVFGCPCIHKGSIKYRSFHWRGYNRGYRNEAWKSRHVRAGADETGQFRRDVVEPRPECEARTLPVGRRG